MAIRIELREEGRVYIDELGVIVHRKVNTIRKWEKTDRLPKYLHSKRGTKNWRYWTPNQVEKIIAWMKRNDMRPGRLLTDPDSEHDHINNLRKPRYLNGHHIKSAKYFVSKGKSRAEIIEIIFPRTNYTSPKRCEAALVKLFYSNGWDFPPRSNHRSRLSKQTEQEIKRLEKQVTQLTGGNNGNEASKQTENPPTRSITGRKS